MTGMRADVEEIRVTKTERLLAYVLVAFLLLGAIWTYTKIDNVIRRHEPIPAMHYFGRPSPPILKYDAAQQRVYSAQARVGQSLRQLEFTREAYRTALEAHRPTAKLSKEYDAAQAAYALAQHDVQVDRAQVRALKPAADAAERQVAAKQRDVESKIAAAYHRQSRDIFLVRLGMVSIGMLLGFSMLAWMRRRVTRWYPLAASVVGAATIFAFFFACDYATDYIHPFDWGIAFIAGLGIVATLVAYWTLQRYITRRLPIRRVRKHECPFCGFPASSGSHCEGCGREIVAPCARCESPRRVGTTHCTTCGGA